MSLIPDTVPPTAEGYLKYLDSQITRAREHWTHYGWALAAAYTAGYEQQLRTLKKVRREQDARRSAEHAFVNFCFSLLTVGVAGGVAGALARKVFTNAAGKKNEVAIDAMKQVLQRGQQQRVYDPVMEALNPPDKTADDIFAPVGATPVGYTTKLQEGISAKTTLLVDILDQVQWSRTTSNVKIDDTVITLKSSGDKLTTADAKYLTEAILNSSFMKEMPDATVNSDDLAAKAALALWIGWAYARDPHYWSVAKNQHPIVGPQTNTAAYNEQFEWEPARLDIAPLGVPTSYITVVGSESLWMNNSRPIKGLYMWGLMRWAASADAAEALLDGLPTNTKGLEFVKSQMVGRTLTDSGWVDAKPGPQACFLPPRGVPPLSLQSQSRW
jgi:hypothetical protein